MTRITIPLAARVTVNRWIAGETARTRSARARRRSSEYKFNEAAGALYQFVWNVFCDWYLELIKPILTGTDEAAKAETRATAAWVLDQILLLLHPFMPFVTEELWQQTGTRERMADRGRLARPTRAWAMPRPMPRWNG